MEKKEKDVAASSSSLRIKTKKIKRDTLRHCSKRKLQLKETCGDQVSGSHPEITTAILQSTVNDLTNEDAVYNLPGILQAPDFNHTVKETSGELVIMDEIMEGKTMDEIMEGPTEILHSTVNEVANKDADLPGIPIESFLNQTMKPKVIFVLDKASLVPELVGTRWRILNSNIHVDYLREKKLDPSSYRPDIIHDALLEIIGSRLSQAGRVEAIYVKTDTGVLIKVDPRARIPESLGKFCSMMLHVLQDFNVNAMVKRHGNHLSVVPNPVAHRLPFWAPKIGLSFSSKKTWQLEDYVSSMNVTDDMRVVFVVGAMAHGEIETCYTDDLIAVSKYRLSTETCVQQINNALESIWKAW